MRKLTVGEFMTGAPVVIDYRASLELAHQLMRAHRVRHLPVMREGKLVGLISQRDLFLEESLAGVDAREVCVHEAMAGDPFCASPDSPLDQIAREMARRKLGSVIVTAKGAVVGIFTAVDALNVLDYLLEALQSAGHAPLPAAPS